VRLASQLSGWDIDVLTEAEESERRQEEFRQRSQMFIDTLDVDEMIAQLLVTEGFSTVDDVGTVEASEISSIEGFDEDVAVELQNRAQAFIEKRNRDLDDRRRELGVSDDIAAIDGLTIEMLVTLGEAEVKTLDDLGDLAGDELIETLPDAGFSEEEANAIIMIARAHWFDDEPAPDAAADAPAETDTAQE
jgi:N utilization substance protein A